MVGFAKDRLLNLSFLFIIIGEKSPLQDLLSGGSSNNNSLLKIPRLHPPLSIIIYDILHIL
jgi:hypothetical protein